MSRHVFRQNPTPHPHARYGPVACDPLSVQATFGFAPISMISVLQEAMNCLVVFLTNVFCL